MIRRSAFILALLAVGGCGTNPRSSEDVRPYVVTAIDYHFHDAHPSLPIDTTRTLEFSNQGSNLHNVTIPGTGFDRNVRPGRRFAIQPVGSLLSEPGRYPFFCALHADRGMKGVLVVTG